MTTSKQYDYLNRLTQISSVPSASGVLPFTYNYSYNAANQRTNDTLADGSYWKYGDDSLGQVTNGCKYFANGTPVAGQQFVYAFDTIGNRTQTQTGGDQTVNNLRVANYYANSLNQVTNRDVPPYADIQGASLLTNAVTINGQGTGTLETWHIKLYDADEDGGSIEIPIPIKPDLEFSGINFPGRLLWEGDLTATHFCCSNKK